MNKTINILLYLLLSIKCQNWWEETNDSKKDDSKKKYKYRFTDFYLCSDRKYRVHFLNSDWSEEFTACQPAGNCKNYIDGIAISGGQYYGARINENNRTDWLNETNEYNIYDNNGFAGQLGKEIRGLYIYGGDYYNNGYYFYGCSEEKNISKRIAKKMFGKELSYIYYNETEIYNDKNSSILITIQLLNISDINFKGKITFKFEKYTMIDTDWGGLIGHYIEKLLKQNFNFDFEYLKKRLEDVIHKNIAHGNAAINFNWSKKKIEIDIATKIEYNYYGYRGGFRINIYLDNENNENPDLLIKIKTICKYFLKYSGKNLIMTKKLLSDCNSFEEINIIMNELGIYSTMTEGVILLLILSPILEKIEI